MSRPWVWAVLFVAAMFGTVALRIFGVVEEPWATVLSLLALALVVPMVVSARRKVQAEGDFSPALKAYNNRIMVGSGVYVLTFLAAVSAHNRAPPHGAWLWLLAIAPTIPLLGMIWAMARYLRDETDEYLRHRAIMAALFGLTLVLVLGTVWGFLETFGVAPHVWSWWVFPVWALGLGIAQCWSRWSRS